MEEEDGGPMLVGRARGWSASRRWDEAPRDRVLWRRRSGRPLLSIAASEFELNKQNTSR